MDSSLKARFERLGPIRVIDPISSGFAARLVLRWSPGGGRPLRSIGATHALARRGMTMLGAKRAIETMIETGQTTVETPSVEDLAALVGELTEAGLAVTVVAPLAVPAIRELRQRLGLSREQFALRYGLEVETLRNWENGKREPDTTARSYLRAIDNDPEQVARAYALMPSGA
jgi:putative transcriptional regulator